MNRLKSSNTSIDVLAKNLINAKSKKLLDDKLMSSMTNDEFESPSGSASPASQTGQMLSSSLSTKSDMQSKSSSIVAPSSPSSLSSSSSTSSTISSSSSSTTSQIAAAMQALFQNSNQTNNLAAAMQGLSSLSAKELSKLNLSDSTNLLAANLLQLQQLQSQSPSLNHSQNRKQQPQKRAYNKQAKKNLDDITQTLKTESMQGNKQSNKSKSISSSSCSDIKQEHDEDDFNDELDHEEHNSSSMIDEYNEEHMGNDHTEDNIDHDLDNEDEDDLGELKRDRNNSTSSPTRSSSSQDQSRSISPSTVFNESTNGAGFPNLASLAAANGIDSTTAMLAAGLTLPGQSSSLLTSAAAAAAAAAIGNGTTNGTPNQTGDLNSLSLISDAAAALITSGNLPNAALPTPANSVANLIASTRKRRTDREQAAERVKKIKPVPDDKKDDAYWERRRKNNEAAKRSRDLRRQKEDEIAVRASFLEQENLKLKAQVTILKAELSKLHFMLYNR